MTAIAGIKTNDGVLLGADSALTTGNDLLVSCVPKVFELDDFVIGVSGSIEIGQYISRGFRIPDRPSNTGLARYMVAHFGPALQQAIKREALRGDYSALIATPENGLFISESGSVVIEPRDPFAAIGSGSSFALGALRATRGDPRSRLLRALEAAAHFSQNVRPPFTILKAESKPWMVRVFGASKTETEQILDKEAAWAPDLDDHG